MKALLTLGLFVSITASAQEILVKNVNADQTKFTATYAAKTPAPTVGQVFEMKDEFDQVCAATVTGQKETWVILDFTKCDSRKSLKEGDKFTLNATPVVQAAIVPPADPKPAVAEPTATEPQEDTQWEFAVGLGAQLSAGAGNFNDAEYYSSGTGTKKGEAELRYKSGFAISFEGRFLPKNGWGLLGGINIEGEREFKEGKLKSGGVEFVLTGGPDASRVQFSTFYASAVYRWNKIYLPFGFNYSSVRWRAASGFTGTSSASGGMGAQLGVGWKFNDLFAVELHSWATSMKLRTSTNLESLDYGSGTFSSLFLIGKLTF